MVVGLIHDVPTCRELVDRIMAQADDLIGRRLAQMMRGSVPA
jgi:nitronate monooxygenase